MSTRSGPKRFSWFIYQRQDGYYALDVQANCEQRHVMTLPEEKHDEEVIWGVVALGASSFDTIKVGNSDPYFLYRPNNLCN
jgi:hypothetical protein